MSLAVSRVGGIVQKFRTPLLTAAAMLCFAANSVLCRFALAPHLIDPVTFTCVRVLSAATILTTIIAVSQRRLPVIAIRNWRSIATLFTYLIFFSFAYTRLSTGTGALVQTPFCEAPRGSADNGPGRH